jgi:hypothetical protein
MSFSSARSKDPGVASPLVARLLSVVDRLPAIVAECLAHRCLDGPFVYRDSRIADDLVA